MFKLSKDEMLQVRQEVAPVELEARKIEAKHRKATQYQNFRGQDLRGKDFSGQDLSYSSFREADLRGANFEGATLCFCSFKDAKIDKTTNFKNAEVYGVPGLEDHHKNVAITAKPEWLHEIDQAREMLRLAEEEAIFKIKGVNNPYAEKLKATNAPKKAAKKTTKKSAK